jgi:hypothetical protein
MFNKDKILKTRNYSLFSFIEGNRKISRSKVERLKKSMAEKYIPIPILASGKHEIIDGQHRFIAVRELELLLHYTISYNFEPEDITRINMHGTNWNNDDFLHYRAKEEKNNYPLNYKSMPYNVLLSAREETKLHHQSLIRLAYKLSGKLKARYNESFKEGSFIIADKKKFLEDVDFLVSVGQYFEGGRQRNFQAALCYVLPQDNFDRDVFLSKLKKYSSIMRPCANTKAYVEEIETLYNYHNRNKITFNRR